MMADIKKESAELSDDEVLTEGPVYNAPQKKTRVDWYRVPLTREELAAFNKKSNFLGFAQTFGHLGVMFGGAGAAGHVLVPRRRDDVRQHAAAGRWLAGYRVTWQGFQGGPG